MGLLVDFSLSQPGASQREVYDENRDWLALDLPQQDGGLSPSFRIPLGWERAAAAPTPSPHETLRAHSKQGAFPERCRS